MEAPRGILKRLQLRCWSVRPLFARNGSAAFGAKFCGGFGALLSARQQIFVLGPQFAFASGEFPTFQPPHEKCGIKKGGAKINCKTRRMRRRNRSHAYIPTARGLGGNSIGYFRPPKSRPKPSPNWILHRKCA